MPRLPDLSIKAKLSASFGLSLALIFVIGAIALVQLWGINALATRVTENWLPEMEILGNTKRAMDEHWLLALRRTSTTNFRQIAADSVKMQTAQTDVDDGVRRLSALANQAGGAGLLARFQNQWTVYRHSLDTVLARLEAGDPELAQAEFDNTTTAAFAGAAKFIDDLLGLSKAEGLSAAENVRSVYGLSLAFIVAVLLLAAASVSGAIRWISLNISKPILKISNAMQRLTAGDESVSVSEGMDRKDEIGVLVGAVAGYRNSLNRIRQLADEANLERQRLDAALTNMSQGLCMFDADEKLVIFNPRFAEIYHLSAEKISPGMTTRELMSLAFDGKFSDVDPDSTLASQQSFIREGKAGSVIERLTDDRSVAISHMPMPGGGFVVTFEDITEQLLAQEKIKHLAHYDSLTDLPNRVTFYEQVEMILGHLRRSEDIAILSLDLDHFKTVNDQYGHEAGDEALKHVARVVGQETEPRPTLSARLGGDEFIAVWYNLARPAAERIAARLTHAIEALQVRNEGIGDGVLTVSIGVSVCHPDLTALAGDCMRRADQALYEAKQAGRNRFAVA